MNIVGISVGASAAVVLATLLTLPRLHPRIGAVALVLSAVSVAVASVWTISVPAFAFLIHSTSGGFADWCRSLIGQNEVPTWLGLPSSVLLVTILARVAVRWRSLRRAARTLPGGDRITVVDQIEPFAMTTPGRSGRVIVSTGLMNALTPLERCAVIAHEEAHLDRRHDRYLLLADLASTAIPIVSPLNRLMCRSLERWADEVAADEVGNRGIVARALEIAARSTVGLPALGSAMGHAEVLARLEALDGPAPINRVTFTGGVLIGLSLGATALNLAGTGFQFHRLLELLVHVCPF